MSKIKQFIHPKRLGVQLGLIQLFALVGMVCSIILTIHFYDIRNGSSGFKSFCNVSKTMNCDIVAASSKAEIIRGVPLSSLGAGWFLGIFLLGFLTWSPSWRKQALQVCFIMSVLGTSAGLFYLAIMAFQLKTYCLLCLMVDGVNVGLLLVLLSMGPVSLMKSFSWKKSNLTRIGTLFLIALGSIGISVTVLKSLDHFSIKDDQLNLFVKEFLSTPVLTIPISDEHPSIGPKDAPITVVEYSDFQCPYCRVGAFILNSVLNRFPNKIRVVFRNFPLNPECNAEVKAMVHPQACEAARVATCAHEQGVFEEAYQELFEEQESFYPGRSIELIQALNLDQKPSSHFSMEAFTTCYRSERVNTLITKDIAAGIMLGVRSTPTFFINGHKGEGLFPLAAWNRIIELLLLQTNALEAEKK